MALSLNPLTWFRKGTAQVPTTSPEMAAGGAQPGQGATRAQTGKENWKSSVPSKADRAEQPRVSLNHIWNPNLIKSALTQADNGNFVTLSALAEAIIAHSRVRSALKLRIGALQALTIDADHPKRRVQRAFRGYYKKSRGLSPLNNDDSWVMGDWWRMLPAATLIKLMAWAMIAGLALVQLKWRYYENIDRWVPRFKVWNLRHLRHDFGTGQWKLKILKRDKEGKQAWEEIVITPGDGEWFIFTPFTDNEGQASDRPWAEGIWRGLAETWLLQNYGVTDWGRYSASKGKGLFVGTTPAAGQPGALEKVARDEFATEIDAAGEFGVLVPRPGCDVKSVADVSKDGSDGFVKILSWFATEASIAILNGNLLQDVKEGSRAAAEVQKELFDAGVTKGDAETLSDWLADGPLAWWAVINFGDGMGPYPRWFMVKDEMAERKAAAEVFKLSADAITAIITMEAARQAAQPSKRKVDLEALLEQFDYPLIDMDQLPEPPPEDDDGEDSDDEDDISDITPEDPEDADDEDEAATAA